ncbi:phosphotransferase, partial [Gemmatimonadota bacterium]
MYKRFRREAQALAGLQHPGIIPVFSVGEAEGVAFMVMPRVGGENLRTVLERQGRIHPEEVRRILFDVASALDEAHRCGVL